MNIRNRLARLETARSVGGCLTHLTDTELDECIRELIGFEKGEPITSAVLAKIIEAS